MTTTQVPDPRRVGQFTQECPSCEGTMPAEAVTVSRWRYSRAKATWLERNVIMACPHCGYKQKRLEIVPQDVFLTVARLSGDRG